MSILIAYLIIGFIFWISLLLQGDGTESQIKLFLAGAFLVALWPACMPSIIRLTDKHYRA